MASSDDFVITDLFVYGTLKRGECRESMWPRVPTHVRPGFIRGRLYDLGPYPAIRVEEFAGEEDDLQDLDWVAGELWSFQVGDIAATIAVLDEIEQSNQRGYRNLYDQVLVRVHDRPRSRTSQLALAYQYSSPSRLDHSRRLRPGSGDTAVGWWALPDDR